MGRHAPRRGGLAAAVSSLVIAVAAASVTVLSQGSGSAEAAGGDTTAITLVDPSSATPRTDRPYVAGDSGFLHRQSGRSGLLWTDYATGRTVTVENADGVYTPGTGCTYLGSECRNAWYGSDSDLVALPTTTSDAYATLWDPATATSRKVSWNGSIQYGQGYYRALAGDTIVTTQSLIDKVDGAWRTRRVTGDATSVGSEDVLAADSSGVLWSVGTGTIGYIDVASAVNTYAFTDATYASHYVMSEDRIGWYQAGTAELHLKSRTDLTGPEQVVTLPANPGTLDGDPVLVGDWLLLPLSSSSLGSKLLAVDVNDPSVQQTLLASAGEYTLAAGDDSALVSGGTDATDWWVRRVSQAEDGTLRMEKVLQSPAVENAKTGIALSRGSLRVAEDDPDTAAHLTSVRTLTTNGSSELTASDATESSKVYSPVCPYAGTTCAALWGNLAAEDVYLGNYYYDAELKEDRLVAIGGHQLEFGTTGGSIVDAGDDYAVYNSGGSTPAQYVGEFGQGQKLKRSVRAATLSGSTLWSATTTAGTLTSYSLPLEKSLATVTVPGLACVPGELQAAGRWLYWACGTDSAGVYDTKAGTSTAVTPGDVLLGDGFTVRHDHTTGTLVLTEAATGTTRTIASDLPDKGLPADRRYRWTVDEYTGLVAWFDDYERTHVITTGIAPSAVTALKTSIGSDSVDPNMPFQGRWVLSRPVTSWSLTFTSVQSGATGKATRTITGGATPDLVSATWNGRTASGSYFPNGHFTWTLKATGLGTATVTTVTTGDGYLQRGAAVRHDFVDGPDGRGDLLTLNSSGGLTFHSGTGTGKFGDKYTGTGWATSITAIPFGDLSGDRCNDVLVRYSSGALRLYKPGCGAAVKPSTPYTTLASSGWTQYNVLTSPGDVSGDGRPDLIARNSSTGAVYLYKGTSDGKLSSRVKLYDNWKGYKKIVGVGDITGDGRADLLAQDTSSNLYRYDGKGDGTFAARVKLFGNWGGSYNAVVGVGDITDDGRPDLVSRDTSGNLWRNSGDGKGSFGPRTQIASGWSGYKSLS
ncbi:VCBS repeat-containing protein [Streptomyces sp. S.PNR 29]|uniref:FG-GAP repeat domain-containing protein n=1 Tax=Streptomyces sp. S.PNR 29 TaxID=2973805 RepID=UPI0025B076E9|nr:VCBS repeat-containing protein [Streptomyces sp. S.PNR 29]MDN0198322.1 VCBS repeat-containing protein [Streptomyces sp. S.PNR 29]